MFNRCSMACLLVILTTTACAYDAQDSGAEAIAQNTSAIHAGDWQSHVQIILAPGLSQPLSTELATLASDMQREGWSTQLVEFSGASAADLKRQLQRDYALSRGHLAGAFLIGDLPWVFADNSWLDEGWGPGIADYWYMDLDGEWRDQDGDGDFDFHGPGQGDRGPEIFVGRLTASNVTVYEESAVELLRAYLHNDHRYRSGQHRLAPRSLVVSADNCGAGSECGAMLDSQRQLYDEAVVMLFEHQDGFATNGDATPTQRWSLQDPSVVTRGESLPLLLRELDGGVNYLSINTHGNTSLWLGFGSAGDYAAHARSGGLLPAFINTHSCLTAELEGSNSMAATLTLGGALGYIGSGALMYYPPEWDVALTRAFAAESASIGEALRALHETAYAADPSGTSVQWQSLLHLLVGDPTLRAYYPRSEPEFVNEESLEVWIVDSGSHAQSSKLRLFIKNVGSSALDLTGLSAQYSFSVAERPGARPVLDDDYTPASAVRLVEASARRPNQWAIEFDFGGGGAVLAPGQATSWGTGSGENVALHFDDWARIWDETNDYSAAGKSHVWSVTQRVDLLRNGRLVYGFRR